MVTLVSLPESEPRPWALPECPLEPARVKGQRRLDDTGGQPSPIIKFRRNTANHRASFKSIKQSLCRIHASVRERPDLLPQNGAAVANKTAKKEFSRFYQAWCILARCTMWGHVALGPVLFAVSGQPPPTLSAVAIRTLLYVTCTILLVFLS